MIHGPSSGITVQRGVGCTAGSIPASATTSFNDREEGIHGPNNSQSIEDVTGRISRISGASGWRLLTRFHGTPLPRTRNRPELPIGAKTNKEMGAGNRHHRPENPSPKQ